MPSMLAGPTARVLAVLAAALAASIATPWGASADARGRSHARSAPGTGAGPKVLVVMTSQNLGWHLTRLPDRRLVADQPRNVLTIHVDDSVRYQKFSGAGGAMTDSSAWLIYDKLAPSTRDRLMHALFGAHGIHLNLLRVPMGASDFVAGGVPYTYDDVPAGQSDPTLARFSIAHDLSYIVPALRQAIALKPHVQILAEPWSPPAWMKTNDALSNLGDRGRLLPTAYGPLAQYFVRFIRAYRRLGIRVDEITAQNEPQAPSAFPGLNLSASDEVRFIVGYLEPALRAARLHPKIYGFDRGALLSYAQGLTRSLARQVLSGIAWHCYGGASYMSAIHLQAPDLDQIVSECSPGLVVYDPAEALISSLRNWASAVGLWNLALDPSGGPVQLPNRGCPHCTGIVTIDEQTHRVTYGLNYYQLGQLTKFVVPGAVRIAANSFVDDFRTDTGLYGVTPGLDDVAFRNPDGSTVLVAYNNSDSWIKFAVAQGRRAFQYAMPPRTTGTFIWRG
jgi:glucosylceramidase